MESVCILYSMLKRIGISLLLLGIPLCAAAQVCVVPDTLWERPRSGQEVVALPALRACVQGILDKPDASLMIHHAVTDEAALHAAELRYWLIALAIEGARIELKNDLQLNEPLNVEVRERK